MNLNDKIRKVKALIERGATDGEKAAARKALERLSKAHNFAIEQDGSVMNTYKFFYTMVIDMELADRIIIYFDLDVIPKGRYTRPTRSFFIRMDIDDHVIFDCAYGYFKPHMAAQWRKNVTPILKRCRTAKSRKARQERIERRFMAQYLLKSGLITNKDLTFDAPSSKELNEVKALRGIEGGNYNQQLNTGLYLD